MFYKFLVKGVVQGVGFRPYIYNSCVKNNLLGYVQNIGSGVIIVVNNKDKLIDILKTPPPLAKIDSYSITEINENYSVFTIKSSSGIGFAKIPQDISICDDCILELQNPNNKRHNYFFITCTNCGPRFTITKITPYDRKTTTMYEFPMCSYCETEYKDPKNRRYHAQTIACPSCGPKIHLLQNNQPIGAIKEATDLIKKGEIIAIKGFGGFHLVCNLESTNKLRKLTNRKYKPFAIMVKDLEMLDKIAIANEKQKQLLSSKERPILILKKRKSLNPVSELDTLGIMLPYTAIHYLIFNHINKPLIVTSSNMPSNPISYKKEHQFVPFILTNSRKIHNPLDDSIIKTINNKSFFIRRSRGYVPNSIKFDSKKTILALGAEQNSSFCILKDNQAILSQYLGNTSNLNAFDHYKKMLNNFLNLTKAKPDLILSDIHPNYNTTIYATKLSKQLQIPHIKVQHHLAHAYSVAKEHNLDDFTAIVCDGMGYNQDGTIWGGELISCQSSVSSCQRIGRLEPQIQLGGDSATIYPAKMLFSILSKFLNKSELQKAMQTHFSAQEQTLLNKQLQSKLNCPITTSCGRILDAASTFLGFCKKRDYEARPALLLEANSTTPLDLEPIIKNNILQTTPLFEFLIENQDKDKSKLAATVQYYLADGLFKIANKYKNPITFSGGCAYNTIMNQYMQQKGVFLNKQVPPGDGGISFGQIAAYSHNPQLKTQNLNEPKSILFPGNC